MEREQVQQFAVGRGRHHAEAAHAVRGAAAVQGFDRAQVLDFLEQLAQGIGGLGALQRADDQLDGARGRLRDGHRLQRRTHRRGHGGGLHDGGGRLAFGHRADAAQQLAGVGRGAGRALVHGELRLQRVAGGQQHVHHGRRRGQLVAAQLVQQRLHLVRQRGDVGEAEGGGAALDRVRATEDGVHLLVVRRVDVELQQLLLHQLQVLAGFLEEDLVELAQVDAGRAAVVTDLTHYSYS